MTFGKVVGGGLPVAAVGGPAAVMDRLAPLGPVYQAGTLSGNPVAVAAGLATLRLADAAVYARMDDVADVLRREVSSALETAGVPHRVQHAGNLFSVFFGERAAAHGVRDYAQAKAQDTAAFTAFFHAMLDAGVALPPSAFEAWFVTAAHDDTAVDRILWPCRPPLTPQPPRPAPEAGTATRTHETDRTAPTTARRPIPGPEPVARAAGRAGPAPGRRRAPCRSAIATTSRR